LILTPNINSAPGDGEGRRPPKAKDGLGANSGPQLK